MLARTMCKLSKLPFAEVNATQFTEAGYAGLDLRQMYLPLIESAARVHDAREGHWEGGLYERRDPEPRVLKRDSDSLKEIVELAQTGVIFLDEFDKWMHRQNHVTGRLDTAIQGDLLKMVEGSFEYVTDEEGEIGVPFDTSRVLIICAGAFVGLARHAARRLDLSFDSATQQHEFWDKIEPGDFVQYGLIPELAGRLSTHIFLRPLRVDHLAEIIRQPGGLIEEYRERFEAVDCEWRVSDAAISTIAAEAIERQTGARGIENVCWKRFSEALFEASVSKSPTSVTLEINAPRATVHAAVHA
jgi:ATP-dependent Clp protease ATP-binding subunit ClpX